MNELFVILLIANAIFWGMFSHDTHMDFCNNILNVKCPEHITLLSISILSFMLAIFIAQKDFFLDMYKSVLNIAQTGGRVLLASKKLIKNTANSYNTPNEFADSFEEFVESALE